MTAEGMELIYQLYMWGALMGALLIWALVATGVWLIRYKESIRYRRFIGNKNLHKAYDEWELNYLMEKKIRQE